MKKIIITMFLLSFITACTIEDQSVEIDDSNLQTEDVECIPVSGNSSTIMTSEFSRTGFELETAVDANGDGVFSTELADEGLCGADILRFNTDSRVWNVESSFVSLKIDQDNNQQISCSHADGLAAIFIQTDDIVDFCVGGQIRYSGTLSNNENTLTITLPYDQLYGFFLAGGGNDILLPDGTIENYEGSATITYTRL